MTDMRGSHSLWNIVAEKAQKEFGNSVAGHRSGLGNSVTGMIHYGFEKEAMVDEELDEE
jgi:hypothetical protein